MTSDVSSCIKFHIFRGYAPDPAAGELTTFLQTGWLVRSVVAELRLPLSALGAEASSPFLEG